MNLDLLGRCTTTVRMSIFENGQHFGLLCFFVVSKLSKSLLRPYKLEWTADSAEARSGVFHFFFDHT